MYFAEPWERAADAPPLAGIPVRLRPLVIFASPAAIGAGLQVAACVLVHEAKIGAAATVLSVAISIAVYGRVLRPLLRAHAARHPFRPGLLAGTAAILVLSVLLAVAGVDVSVYLVVMVLAPATTVVGYETSVTATSRTRWSGCDRGRLGPRAEPGR
jgi:hypothetical protein